MTTREPKLEFKVWYKPNPEYSGTFPGPQKLGLQGTFVFMVDAEKAVEKCKKYFNEQHELTDNVQRDGTVKREPKISFHNNVIVWIEKYQDGTHVDAPGTRGPEAEIMAALEAEQKEKQTCDVSESRLAMA